MGAGRIKILLVDDDQDAYVLTQELLSESGSDRYELDWVPSYEDALQAVMNSRHDMYLIDYRLGNRTGLDLLRDAIALGCKAPIVLLTGQGDHQVDIEAMKAGAVDYLVKSQIDAALLERSIRYSLERARAEDDRAILEQQLHHSQKIEAMGQLASGVAHDFNNLLTAIFSYTHLGLSISSQGSQLWIQLQEIRKAAERATGLTRQLLAFSRRQIIESAVLNLNDLVLNTDKMLRRLIGENIELVTLTSSDLGPVKVDPAQIEQVLINLAVNARDAMPEGGKLTIETSNIVLVENDLSRLPDLAAGEHVKLAVSDTGTGISEDVKARVFEPFFTTKEGKGSGLGLSTCYGIVKQNGGEIEVESELGKGTTFKIYLRRVDEELSSFPKRETADSLPEGEETVLLVEDEELVRGVAAHVLRQQGYTVLEAENGGEAIRLVARSGNGQIDLLLTDVVMPLMGGRELADRLRETHVVSRVLYTSEYTDSTIAGDGLLGPETRFLEKPFTPWALATSVREVLDAA